MVGVLFNIFLLFVEMHSKIFIFLLDFFLKTLKSLKNLVKQMTIHLTICNLQGTICETDINNTSTVGDLKAVIVEYDKTILISELSLVFRGQVLEDERTIASYGIKDGDKIFTVSRKKKNVEDDKKKDPTASRRPNSSENSFSSLMNSPIGKYIMNMIRNNPQAYADMLRSNPIFNQIAESNPQLQHVLNDSDMLSEQMNLFLNPENQNQTALTMDRMLDTVESMPGGFQILSKQINDLQEPLFDGIMEQFKGNGKSKTNIDTKAPLKPSEDPIPFGPPPPQFSQNSPFNFLMQGLNEYAPPAPAAPPSIPPEAIELINNGIEKCRSKGLIIADLPGFKDLVDACSAFPTKNNVNFYQLYADQLKQMNEMGFKDNEMNIRALIQSNGDIGQAIDYMSEMYQ